MSRPRLPPPPPSASCLAAKPTPPPQLLVIPTVMAIEFWTAGKTTPLPEKLSLVVLLLGVGVSTVTDISLTGVRWSPGTQWHARQLAATQACPHCDFFLTL